MSVFDCHNLKSTIPCHIHCQYHLSGFGVLEAPGSSSCHGFRVERHVVFKDVRVGEVRNLPWGIRSQVGLAIGQVASQMGQVSQMVGVLQCDSGNRCHEVGDSRLTVTPPCGTEVLVFSFIWLLLCTAFLALPCPTLVAEADSRSTTHSDFLNANVPRMLLKDHRDCSSDVLFV